MKPEYKRIIVALNKKLIRLVDERKGLVMTKEEESTYKRTLNELMSVYAKMDTEKIFLDKDM